MLIRVEHILLGSMVKGCSFVELFFFIRLNKFICNICRIFNFFVCSFADRL